MDPESKLASMGLALPAASKPFATYRAAVQSGDLLFVAGQGPTRDGKVTMQGKVGEAVTPEMAYEAARLSALNGLAVVKMHAGSLSKVKQVVSATIWVAGVPSFTGHPQVANGATDLLKELWGEMGLPARAAVGAPSLPMDIPVEVALVVELTR